MSHDEGPNIEIHTMYMYGEKALKVQHEMGLFPRHSELFV